MNNRIPHLVVVVAVTFFVLIGFTAVSAFALLLTNDNTTQGNVIGTWTNFAMLGVGFWLGSSSAGKAKDDAPTETKVINDATNPIPVEPKP